MGGTHTFLQRSIISLLDRVIVYACAPSGEILAYVFAVLLFEIVRGASRERGGFFILQCLRRLFTFAMRKVIVESASSVQ